MKAIKDMKLKRSWWIAIVAVVMIVSVSILSVAYTTTKMNEANDICDKLNNAYDRLLSEKSGSSDKTSDASSGNPASDVKNTEPENVPAIDPYADITCRDIMPTKTENLTLGNISEQVYTIINANDGIRGDYLDRTNQSASLFIYKYDSDANLSRGVAMARNAIEALYSNDTETAMLAFSKGPFLFMVSSYRNMGDNTMYAPSQETYELANATGYYADATIIIERSANLK